MRVLITGGRSFSDREFFFRTLDQYAITEITHGGAKGADSLATEYAYANKGIILHIFPAEWTKMGKIAGSIRNRKMLDTMKPELVIAFAGGKGTQNMVDYARMMGCPVREHYNTK